MLTNLNAPYPCIIIVIHDTINKVVTKEKTVLLRINQPLLGPPNTTMEPIIPIKLHIYGKERFENRLFGIPVVARLSGITSGYDVCKEFLTLIYPFLTQST
ncbi:hypothetical protein RYX36_032009 [Vicia faba]